MGAAADDAAVRAASPSLKANRAKGHLRVSNRSRRVRERPSRKMPNLEEPTRVQLLRSTSIRPGVLNSGVHGVQAALRNLLLRLRTLRTPRIFRHAASAAAADRRTGQSQSSLEQPSVLLFTYPVYINRTPHLPALYSSHSGRNAEQPLVAASAAVRGRRAAAVSGQAAQRQGVRRTRLRQARAG
jgi:hypothetical protein